jgi:hypothetical protein
VQVLLGPVGWLWSGGGRQGGGGGKERQFRGVSTRNTPEEGALVVAVKDLTLVLRQAQLLAVYFRQNELCFLGLGKRRENQNFKKKKLIRDVRRASTHTDTQTYTYMHTYILHTHTHFVYVCVCVYCIYAAYICTCLSAHGTWTMGRAQPTGFRVWG